MEQLKAFINSLPDNPVILLAGDFNLPNVSWNDGIVKCPANSKNKSYIMQKHYLEFFYTFNLRWLVTDNITTRRRKVLNTLQEATLDQILISDETLFKELNTLPGLGKSDHIALICSIGITNDTSFLTMEKENWSKFNIGDIISYGSKTDWNYSQNPELSSSEHMWNELLQKLEDVAKHVPRYQLKVSRDGSILEKSPWNRPCLDKARKRKEKSWRDFDANPNAKTYRLAVSTQLYFDEKLRKCLQNYEYKLTSQLKTNPKQFYRYLNSKRKTKDSLNGIKGADGNPLSSPEEVANELGSFFESTFVNEPDGEVPSIAERNTDTIPELVIGTEEVKKLLKDLNIFKSIGPDNVHPKILKSLSANHSFVNALTKLFQKIYDTGILPPVWKKELI